MNEPQTRLDLIDPAIRAAGWTAANGCRMLVEQSACEFAPGRVGKVRGKPLRADYILVASMGSDPMDAQETVVHGNPPPHGRGRDSCANI